MSRASQPLIVCPLKHEARALTRAGLSSCAMIEVTGVGPASIARWCKRRGAERGRIVILAGVAGALTDRCNVGEAYRIGRIVSADGSNIGTPTLAGDTVITSVEEIIADEQRRAACVRETRADLVDMESAAFARCAQESGWRWAIIRGVSDGPTSPLPRYVTQWAKTDGTLDARAVMRDLALHPLRIPAVMRLGRHTARALRAVAAEIAGEMREIA
jgi:nucleoside phosphorylase